MGVSRSPRPHGRFALLHALHLLEAAMLGRGHAQASRMVDHARSLGADAFWCMRCGAWIGRNGSMPEPVAVGQGPTCDRCVRAPAFAAFVRLGRYDSALGALARSLKRRAWHRVAALLGERMAWEVSARLIPPLGGWRVVPVPSHLLRRLSRGIDHTRELARSMSRVLDAPLVDALALGRSSRQAGLGRRQRLARRARMRCRRGMESVVGGHAVLLVDDVRTTGSTLSEARELLDRMGARFVVPVVVCVAESHKDLAGRALRCLPIGEAGPESRQLVHSENPLKEGC